MESEPQLLNGSIIRNTREHLSLSQQDLAGKAGISRAHLARIELGQKSMSKETMHRIWGALWKFDQHRKAYTSPEILIRLSKARLVISQAWETK